MCAGRDYTRNLCNFAHYCYEAKIALKKNKSIKEKKKDQIIKYKLKDE